MMKDEIALVVFSGGQDSTTCLYWAKKHFKEVRALTFLYGQKHRAEVDVAREITRQASVECEVMDVSFVGGLGRNALTDPTLTMDKEKPADSVPNVRPRPKFIFPQYRGRLCERTRHPSSGDGRVADRFQRVPRLSGCVGQIAQCDAEFGNGQIIRHPYPADVAR